MKTKISYKLMKSIYLLLFCLIVSCGSDSLNPTIQDSYSTYVVNNFGSDQWSNKGYPGTLAVFTGTDMNDIKSVVFDGKISVVFNPSLNSNNAIKFEIPFDASKGSRFGVQDVVFTNKYGQSFSTKFEILQPQPEVISFNVKDTEVSTAKPGDVIEVNGKWFYGITGLLFDGKPISNFTVVSPEKITFTVPNPLPNPNDVQTIQLVNDVIPLNPDLTPKNIGFLDIDTGFDKVLVTDFGFNKLIYQGAEVLDSEGFPVYDAKGYIPTFAELKLKTGYSDQFLNDSRYAVTAWPKEAIGAILEKTPEGGRTFQVEEDNDTRRGKFISLQWGQKPTGTDNFFGLDLYVAATPYLANPDASKIQTDPSKVFFTVDIKGTPETIGTTGFFYLTDRRFLFSCLFTIDQLGWKTYNFRLSELGFSFDPSDIRPNRRIEPATLKQIRICLNNNPAGADTPEKLAAIAKPRVKYFFDNLFIKYERK
jgi:hypothetical protein